MRRLAAILALSALLLATSAAAAPNPANQAALDKTVRFLQEAQNADGGFGGSAGSRSSQMISAWVALALAAAGINPQDQRKPDGLDVHTYLVNHYQQGVREGECAPLACTTMLERELMVVNASGTAPHDFGGVDLVQELLARASPAGWFPHGQGGQAGVNDTIFAIFALAPVEEPGAQAAIQPAADWVEDQQHGSGGWHWATTSTVDEVDMTGAAIQALVAAGRGGNAAVQEGLDYLRAAQNPDGGFPAMPGDPESNVASTAWAVQAIWAVGENPETWRTGSGRQSEEPLDYMESLQAPDGHIRWKLSDDMNGVWMTAYTTPAFGGHNWPIPAPPRAIVPPPAPPQPGQGGGGQAGEGVIAGGGGNGAPLFSRPQPQSKGKTPGGARVLHNKGVPAANQSESRRGENAEQPQQALHAEPTVPADSPEASAAGTQGLGPHRGGGSEGTGSGAGARGEGGGAGAARLLRALAGAGEGSQPGAAGEEVSGALIGSAARGELAFGAPGLHGAGGSDDEETVAIAIGAVALLVALGGAGWERRRQEAIA